MYGCQVVATNPTSGKQRLELLVQIPRGAVPVLNARETKGQRFELAPYHTETFDYAFYFPRPSGEAGKNIGRSTAAEPVSSAWNAVPRAIGEIRPSPSESAAGSPRLA